MRLTKMVDRSTAEPHASVLRTFVSLCLAALDSVFRSRVNWRQQFLDSIRHEPVPSARTSDYYHSRFGSAFEAIADVLRMLLVGICSGLAALLTLISAPDIFEARLYGGVSNWRLRHAIGLNTEVLVGSLAFLIFARIHCRKFHRLRLSTYVLLPAELLWLVWLTFILCAPLCE